MSQITRKMMDKKRISIIIPTLNEEGNIRNIVQRIDAALTPADVVYELIFIDDHSKDGTVREINNYARKYPITVHLKRGKRGKGYSIVEGFEHVKYELTGIIDADLQYPPEAMPEMIEKITSGVAGLVIADRDERLISFTRRFFSKCFKLLFGTLLYGFSGDIQSGLKVFPTKLIKEVKIEPHPWAWDLQLALGARDTGRRVDWVKILFAKRESGVSKLKVFNASFEIGMNAIRMRFRRKRNFTIPADGPGMIGAGVAKNGSRFITHSLLDQNISALTTFTFGQKFLITSALAVIAAGLWLNLIWTATLIMGILSAIYFFDALFNLILVSKSLRRPPEINFSHRELAALDDKDLPMYTVLCPLFRESQVLPGFVRSISEIDWPKDKLEVLLLLEENDQETISTARSMLLPEYVKVVVVPHSMPKTKPKACNYGLSIAKGDYLVIYDAEDLPERRQLKKAYLGFHKLPRNVKCLQAKLNYFNTNQNLLTRLFTAEYSLWFDVILPGLQSINTSIPLGGTSNHFRTADLRDLKGWDPFNVTEDADLGTRLFTMGARTAIIDSVTLEEANSNLKNWIRQRSRWIKGYMQTYLVHMRRPFKFWAESGRHFFLFQMNIGGKVAFMIINPILWTATLSYFALNAYVGSAIESIYPTPVLYMAATSLIFGNFFYFYCYMIGCAKRNQWSVIKFIFFIPVYWFFMSVAALMATYELIVRPHYWQKTNHGLHLAKKKSESNEIKEALHPVIQPEMMSLIKSEKERKPQFQTQSEKTVSKSLSANPLLSRGGILITAMMLSNFINFLFSAFLSRKLNLDDLGLVTLINTLWYVAGIFITGISSTINHRTAYLSAKDGELAGIHFWKVTLRMALMVSLAASLAWLLAVPFLSDFFQIENPMVLLIFTPAMTLGVIGAANRGFLQGNLMFQSTAVTFVVEATVKFLAAGLLVHYGYAGWVFISIPISILATATVAMYLSRNLAGQAGVVNTKEHSYEFPKFFYAASIMSSISSAIFLSLDLILVKHFLDPIGAGEYSLLSLVGKMIYFLGSLPAIFMITLVSRDEGMGKNPSKTFNAIFLGTASMVIVGFVALGLLGQHFVPLLLGPKTIVILDQLKFYTLAIALFTLANVIVSYHLAKEQYIFPAFSLITSALMALGIIVYHNSIQEIVTVILASSVIGLGMMSIMHIWEWRFKFVSANFLDFFDAFIKRPVIAKPQGGRRILIFNWRDTKHVFAGGAEIYIHEIAKRMAAKGDYVTLFSGNDGKCLRNEVVDGVNVIRRGGFFFVYAWAILYYFLQFRGQYDIIIDCHNGIPFFTPIYAKEPVICVVHHIHQEVFKRLLPLPMALFACFLERDLMPIVYRNNHFVTVSPSSKAEMSQFGLIGKGIEIIHNGVDLNNFKPAEKSLIPTILYLGRLKAYKSVDVLITAFKLLSERIPDASLIIAGSGEEDAHLKRLTHQLGLDNRIIFTGKVTEKEKIGLLQKSWVLVNPSFMEGWGITTIEANACGTPVVGADVSGLRDSIRNFETGYLVPHGDSNGFADKIGMIVQDRRLRLEFSNESLRWAKNFSWDKSVRQLSYLVSAK